MSTTFDTYHMCLTDRIKAVHNTDLICFHIFSKCLKEKYFFLYRVQMAIWPSFENVFIFTCLKEFHFTFLPGPGLASFSFRFCGAGLVYFPQLWISNSRSLLYRQIAGKEKLEVNKRFLLWYSILKKCVTYNSWIKHDENWCVGN